MTATTVDLRYKTHEILRSLEHFESVLITRRGKPVGTIVPFSDPATASRKRSVREHSFFGCDAAASESVEDELDRLRGGRYDAV